MKTNIFICHVVEVNPCVNCPFCCLDEPLMLRLRHCVSNPYQEMLRMFINSENTSNICKSMSKIFLSLKQLDDTPIMLDKINHGLFLLDKPEF